MRKILFVLLAFFSVFLGCNKKGCMEPTALNYDSKAKQEDGSCEFEIVVGSSFQGGIVFYVDGLGGGLIAAPTDQSTGAPWGCYWDYLGVTGTAIGTGNQNTIDGCSDPGTAAQICASLVLSDYTDWFLPSRDELDLMYNNIGPGNILGLGNIGDFSNEKYWSSSEVNYYEVSYKNFNDGSDGAYSKTSSLSVRAVRAF